MRILLIDDDKDIFALVRIAFRSEPVELIWAATGLEGLRLFDIRRQIDPVTNQPVIAGLFGPNGSFVRYNMYESTDQYETSNLKELQNKGINFDINKHLVWPIPQSEIDRSFGTVTQNPNY